MITENNEDGLTTAKEKQQQQQQKYSMAFNYFWCILVVSQMSCLGDLLDIIASFKHVLPKCAHSDSLLFF